MKKKQNLFKNVQGLRLCLYIMKISHTPLVLTPINVITKFKYYQFA
jgi:hypothetical protein